MRKIRTAIIGGFYGAGKTTAIMRMGKRLSEEGKKVAVVSNDKGALSVDGELMKNLGFEAGEITGGCVCFYLRQLDYIIDTITKKFTPDVLFLEPVAYFLPSRLDGDLRREFGELLDIAPVTILVDALQVLRSYWERMTELPFIITRQIEDAEVVAINKIDLVPQDKLSIIQTLIQRINPEARLLMISAKSGIGLNEFLDVTLNGRHEAIPPPIPPVIKGFVKSTVQIGWRGEQYVVAAERAIDGFKVKNFISDLLTKIAEKLSGVGGKVAHIKACISNGGFLKASLVSLDQGVDFIGSVDRFASGTMIINAIGMGVPDDFIYGSMVETLREVAPRHEIKFERGS